MSDHVELVGRLTRNPHRYEPNVDLRVVPPLCSIAVSPADFSQGAEPIDQARRSTEAWLAEPQPAYSHQAALVEPHAHS